MRRIICLGNCLIGADAAGPRVHAVLERWLEGAPAGVELIDGGLAGLDLLALVAGAERVVFVDGTIGLGEPGEVAVHAADEVASMASGRFDHASGLPFLLACLPRACEGAVPEIAVVGLEGPASDAAINRAASLSLRLATGASSSPLDAAADTPGGL